MTDIIYDNPNKNARELWVDGELRVSVAQKFIRGSANNHWVSFSDDFTSIPWVPNQRVKL